MTEIRVDREFKLKLNKMCKRFQISESKVLIIMKKAFDLLFEVDDDIKKLLEALSQHLIKINEFSPELRHLIDTFLLKYFGFD